MKKYTVKTAIEWALHEMSLESNWRNVSDEEVLRIVLKASDIEWKKKLKKEVESAVVEAVEACEDAHYWDSMEELP